MLSDSEVLTSAFAKVIAILTTICLLSMLILIFLNVTSISSWYLVLYITMFILMILELRKLPELEHKNPPKKLSSTWFWAILFVWNLGYIGAMGFTLGRWALRQR